jgi:hypothetical protein
MGDRSPKKRIPLIVLLVAFNCTLAPSSDATAERLSHYFAPVNEGGLSGDIGSRTGSPPNIFMSSVVCQNAAESFQNLLREFKQLDNLEPQYDELWSKDANFRLAADAYRNACLKPVDRATAPAFMGVLLISGVAQCMAFQTTSDHLLTARHCLYTGMSLGKYRDPTSLEYRPLNGNTLYPVWKVIPDVVETLPGGVAAASSDYVALVVAGLPAIQLPVLQYPNAEETVRVIGLFGYGTLDAGDHVYEDTACTIAIRSPMGCVLTSCQSAPGFSGSPLFSVNSGQLRIAAMHVSAATLDRGCGFSDVTSQGNIAVTPTAYWGEPK